MILVLILILLFIVLIGCSIAAIIIFNSIVGAKQNVTEAWADIDVQLKRRHDLIPALLDTVKGYAAHEKILFESIAQKRTEAMGMQNRDINHLSSIETDLSTNIKSLLAVAEAYPDLQANQDFLKLQSQLSETEDQIASSRRIYNSNVADYNTKIAIFPNNIVASIEHFTPSIFFQK